MSFLENMTTDEKPAPISVYIERLKREVEYWKKTAKKLRRNEHKGIRYLKRLNGQLFAENKRLKKKCGNSLKEISNE